MRWAVALVLCSLAVATSAVTARTPDESSPDDGFPVHGVLPSPTTADGLAAGIFGRMDRSVDSCKDFFTYACGAVTPDSVTLDTMGQTSYEYVNYSLTQGALARTPAGLLYGACMADRVPSARVGLGVTGAAAIPLLGKAMTTKELYAALAEVAFDPLFSVQAAKNYLNRPVEDTAVEVFPSGLFANVPSTVLAGKDEAAAGARRELRAKLHATLRLAAKAGLLEGVLASGADDPPHRAVWQTLDEVIEAVIEWQVVLSRHSAEVAPTDEAVARPLRRDGPLVAVVGVLEQSLPKPLPRSTMALIYKVDYFEWLAGWIEAAFDPADAPDSRIKMATLQADAAARHVLGLVGIGVMGLDAQRELDGKERLTDPDDRRSELDTICREGVVERFLPDLLSADFVRRFFSGADRRRATKLQGEAQEEVVNTLRHTPWLGAQSRGQIVRKMQAAKTYVGGPTRPDTYADVVIPRELSNTTYATGLSSLNTALNRRRWVPLYDPSATDAWGNPAGPILASRVNAAYFPRRNALYINAAIVGWPVLPTHPALAGATPAATEYGALGFLFGHEYGHGLDSTGIRYDDDVVLGDGGWTPADREAFKNRTNCMVRLYDSYPPSVDPETGANITAGLGASTLNENIADYMGIRAGYYAMTTARKRATAGSGGGGRWAGGVAATNRALAAAFTDEQLYYVSAAQFWYKPPTQAVVVDHDRVHATSALRVRGPMSQFR